MDTVSLGLLVTSAAIFIRLAVSLHPYSGAGNPPMYGDYEAQRHWMEITYHTPLQEWYYPTSTNNLTYWGLDYPPLTAYHSWLCGAIAHRLNPAWVALISSHGFESYDHKLFMRYSVLAADILVLFSAIAVFVSVFWTLFVQWRIVGKDRKDIHNTASNLKLRLALILLLQPGLLLIDYGHFQYNCISLGLALWGILSVITDHTLLGAVAFSLALNYKQMELYHALPFFFFLLGKSFSQTKNVDSSKKRHQNVLFTRGIFNVTKIGVVVMMTFLILWLPFFKAVGLDGGLQVLRRLFPFNRGLYEDKVANFWCSLSVLVKMRQLFSQGTLVMFSTGMTLFAALPSSLYLLWHPQPYHFMLALVNSSLSFFLFSFQVHEKSILLACLPVSLLTPFHPFLSTVFQLVATFSMYPLLGQDGLCLVAWSLTCLFSLVSVLFLDKTKFELPLLASKTKTLFLSLLAMLLTLCTLSHIIPPPPTLPHIFPVLISGLSFVHFLSFYFYFTFLTFYKRPKTENVKIDRYGSNNCPPPYGLRGTIECMYSVAESVEGSHVEVAERRPGKTHTD